ncbi:hypothetical protein CC1G_15217 [Coprinopsis cinerea okayama7|uniref:Uncharacterized protein n=1 Tax=Coprinopsis cinerea (strain Okayama-7 / 130 / ATCC MYA-4618 / FGSC 9003) TaxID=240176 RepID=D6RPK2_COPC7|nr:hypothetical protein CC1G_15217 [Coprinopsis cinerea okayama7\|eukprot:XP_002910582.1 hypothetical protein CC1G_15217 [Coprinopsis cinerea okayama7\
MFAGRNENSVYDPTLSDPNDHCISTSGPLIFVQRTRPDGSTFHPPKCANFDTFSLFSDRMGPILGAKLVMNSNWTNLYSCGKERNIYWKADSSNEPAECNVAVQLFTLPVV